MIRRGITYFLAFLMAGMTLPWTFASDLTEKYDPSGIGELFIGDVLKIQAETSPAKLQAMKDLVQEKASLLTDKLNSTKAQVNSLREDIKKIDASIQSGQIQLAQAVIDGNSTAEEAILKKIEAERRRLVSEEKKAYENYTHVRGRAIVVKIIGQALINEIDKRFDQLDHQPGNGIARGKWSAKYTAANGKTTPRGGDFSLSINTNGVISGCYRDGGGRIPVSGTLNPVSGACQGTGSDPSCPATWSGTLKKNAGSYTGKGSLSFKPKLGGSGSGSWSTE